MIKKINDVFHLKNEKISYIFKVKKTGALQHIYFGEKIDLYQNEGKLQQLPIDSRSLDYYDEETTETGVINNSCVEFAGQQIGDTKAPNIIVSMDDSNTKYDFKYDSYEILEQSDELKPFPETRKNMCQTLRVKLKDSEHDLEIYLYYTIYSNENCIVRKTGICNKSNKEVAIDHLCSMNVDFNYNFNHMLTLQGGLQRECDCVTQSLETGSYSINSAIGHSSAFANPFMALSENDFDDDYGRIYSTLFMYSGNYEILLENSRFDTARLTTSINKNTIKLLLNSKEVYETPESLLFYSDGGLNQMRINHHNFIRGHVINPQVIGKHNMITVNCWEGMEFDINTERLIPLIDKAAMIDAELFVIDDGWFASRNDDTSSLGDWTVDKHKFPGDDFKKIVDYTKSKGLKFGLWFEPEMINYISELYENNPDWVLGANSKNLRTGRNQLMLDMTNVEVINKLFDMIDKMISEYKIDYIKWDMNRDIAESNSKFISSENQGRVSSLYMEGVYKLLHKILSKYPNLIIEGCASGGNRFDLGMLYYMPQIWVSDNTDAIRRIRTQYGLSLVYPLSTQDNAVTNDMSYMGRSIPLSTRMNVASFGNFGYIYDLTNSSLEVLKEEKKYNKFYKKIKNLVVTGDVYMDKYKHGCEYTQWSIVSKNKSAVYTSIFRINPELGKKVRYVKLSGLKTESIYQDCNNSEKYTGSYLMNIGLPVKTLGESRGFYNSFTYYLEEVYE